MPGNSSKRYPPELKQRAVRMYAEVRPDHPTDWAAMTKVAGLLGVSTPETLRKWVRQAEVDQGARPGVTTEESAEIKRLKRENAELRRANAILKAASAFFAAELDERGYPGRSDLDRTRPPLHLGSFRRSPDPLPAPLLKAAQNVLTTLAIQVGVALGKRDGHSIGRLPLPLATEVHRGWAMPGGVGAADWSQTRNVQSSTSDCSAPRSIERRNRSGSTSPTGTSRTLGRRRTPESPRRVRGLNCV